GAAFARSLRAAAAADAVVGSSALGADAFPHVAPVPEPEAPEPAGPRGSSSWADDPQSRALVASPFPESRSNRPASNWLSQPDLRSLDDERDDRPNAQRRAGSA